jgi:RND family efflux transporter MFP subunit
MRPLTRSALRPAWLALGLGMAGVAVAGLAWWWPGAHAQPTPPRPATAKPVPVVTAPVREIEDTLAVDAIGSGQALRSATLQPAVAGEVASLHFKPGDRVRAGQVLLRLVSRRQQLDVELATARVDSTRRLLARYAGTEGTGAVPGSVIDEARSALQSAEIELALAQEALAERVLRAPFDGIVGLAQVDPGDRVTPDTPLLQLDDRRRLLLDFDLPEPYLARVKAGQPVTATSVAYPGRRFEGRLAQIDSRVAPDTRTLRLRAELPNTDDLLRPGMSFQVRLALPGVRQMQVPELALQWGREGGHVWVVRNGQAVQVAVQLVRRLEDTVLVDGALQPGEPVVVEGVQRLRPGRAVAAVNGAASARPATAAP